MNTRKKVTVALGLVSVSALISMGAVAPAFADDGGVPLGNPTVTADSLCEVEVGANTFLTITNPNGVAIEVTATFEDITAPITVPANDSFEGAIEVAEDETVPVKVVFDGVTVYDQSLTRDCVQAPPPPVDVCANLDGVQTEPPVGYTQEGEDCLPIPPPPPTPFVCQAYTDGPVATNADELDWFHTGTRATGKAYYVPGALVLETTDATTPSSPQNKATAYFAVDDPMASFAEPSVVFGNGTGGKPGLQAEIDADNDGVADAMLVGEPWVPGYGNSWSAFNPLVGTLPQFVKDGAPHSDSWKASNYWGSWAEWLAAFPNAQVKLVGLSLGSGVLGKWEVTAFRYGNCIERHFDYVYEDPTVTVETFCEAQTGPNTFITIVNPNDVAITVDATFGGITAPITVPANDSFEGAIELAEDESTQAKVVFNGKTVFDQTVTRDCVAPPVVINPVLPQKICPTDPSGLPYTFPGLSDGPTIEGGNVYDSGNYFTTVDDQRDADGVGEVNFTHTPKNGFVFDASANYVNEDGTMSSTLEFDGTECDTPTPPPTPEEPEKPTTPTESLAQTGADNVSAAFGGALLFLLGGGVLFALRRRHAA